jgi:hypothetical protein
MSTTGVVCAVVLTGMIIVRRLGHGVPNVRDSVRSRGSSIQLGSLGQQESRGWERRSVHRVIGHELNLTKMQLRGKGEPSYFLVTLAGERRIHPTELVSGG